MGFGEGVELCLEEGEGGQQGGITAELLLSEVDDPRLGCPVK